MLQTILTQLAEIETQHGVRVFYACESGSRAWGFPSADSDFDVRFLYVRPLEWYLAIDLELRRDVIETPIADNLDVNGWDLRKALQLFRRSNPPLLEWLGSPIIYYERYTVSAKMRELARSCYSPRASLYHYLSMARTNMRDFEKATHGHAKKSLYVLRPLMAVRWLERGYGVVPTAFDALVERIVEDASLREAIAGLVAAKRRGSEIDGYPLPAIVHEYMTGELARLAENEPVLDVAKYSIDVLNTLFRDALAEVWADVR